MTHLKDDLKHSVERLGHHLHTFRDTPQRRSLAFDASVRDMTRIPCGTHLKDDLKESADHVGNHARIPKTYLSGHTLKTILSIRQTVADHVGRILKTVLSIRQTLCEITRVTCETHLKDSLKHAADRLGHHHHALWDTP